MLTLIKNEIYKKIKLDKIKLIKKKGKKGSFFNKLVN